MHYLYVKISTLPRLALSHANTHILNVVAIWGPTFCRLDKDKMMTKLTLGSHPHMLGFEQLERLLERTAKTGNEGYPPFNIEQTSDRGYRITLAVAGFAEEDLSITVEDRQLVIRGRQRDDSSERVYLHRGIAARQFQRSFVLAEGVDVGDATMENGLLHIDLTQVMPETVVQTIKIKRG
jgi:HSP20 family molecular chaperone IbpA